MNAQLKKLRKVKSDHCITIILNTHRTHPDNVQDPIRLKNLISEAAARIMEYEDKKEAGNLVGKLEQLAASIDHNYNMESLLLFVNEDTSEYMRLPVEVTDRVIIDTTFATRDIIRALNQKRRYYILVLGKDESRLIEALNDKVIQEAGDPFPIKNADHSKTFSQQAKTTNRESALISEYFNFVDKQVNEILKENPVPVLICSEEANYYEYLKIADQKDSIMDEYLNRSRQTEAAHAIVSDAWELVKAYTDRKNNERKEELMKAVSANTFLSDTNEIKNAILEGRVQTLFIENGLYQPAVINDDIIEYKPSADQSAEIVDDIYDDLIEMNMDHGGDVVFLPEGELKEFNGFGAVTRY